MLPNFDIKLLLKLAFGVGLFVALVVTSIHLRTQRIARVAVEVSGLQQQVDSLEVENGVLMDSLANCRARR